MVLPQLPFLVSVSLIFRLMFVYYTLCSVWVAECTSFWEIAAHAVGHMFSLSFVYM